MKVRPVLRKAVSQYGLAAAMIAAALTAGFVYVGFSAADVLFMDFWRNAVLLIPKVMSGELSFGTLWMAQFGQRNFLQLALLAFDIRFLSLNCIWETYAGIVTLAGSAVLVCFEWKSLAAANGENRRTVQLLCIPLVLTTFNMNQWEILSLQFSFAFMLRVLAFLLIFRAVSRLLAGGRWSVRGFAAAGVGAGIVVCLMSQLYFPAMLLSVLFAFGFALFLLPGEWRRKCRAYAAFLLPCAAAVFIYFWGAGAGAEAEKSVLELIFSGDFWFGILYMLVGSTVPQSVTQNWAGWQFAAVGGVFLLVLLGAVFLYFRLRMYEKSFFPMLIAAYGLLSIPIIEFGRLGNGGLLYLTSSRYVCETTLIWTGCAMIYGYAFLLAGNAMRRKIASVVCLAVISAAMVYSGIVEFRIAPFRGAFKSELIAMLQTNDPDNLTDEQLAGFQSPPDTVRQGIALLREYQLNVFSSRRLCSDVGSDLESAARKIHIYGDGWIESGASLDIYVGESGTIEMETYDPYWDRHPDGVCRVYVDDCLAGEFTAAENTELSLSADPNRVCTVRIECDYFVEESPPGERSLCLILSRLEAVG